MEYAMSDIFDQASDREQLERDLAIASARKPSASAQATGHCLWCNAQIEQGKRWCDAECREDWELNQQAFRRKNGRK